MAFSTVPFIFSPNTLIQSAQVNADFASVVEDGNNIDASQITTGVLPVDRGGTGVTTPGEITTSIGAVAKAGDTMTGMLTVPSIVYSGNPYGHGFSFGWDGSATHVFVDGTDVGIIGDITGLGAGNGITVSGTSGVVTVAMSGGYSGDFSVGGSFVAGNNISTNQGVYGAYVHSSGNIDADSSVNANANVNAGGTVYAAGTQMYMGSGGAGQILQMHSGWYWEWNGSNGDLIWGGPSGAQFWVIRYSDHYCGNQIGPVFGFGAYINASDQRGKTDIAPATQGLAEIVKLKPMSFRRIRKEGDLETRVELGFIAQDVRGVLPEAVYPIDAGADPMLGVSLDPIVASLVNAVQQLTARVEALEASRGTP